MAFVDLPGVRLHYRCSGPQGAPVVVLSNSLGTDLHLWERQIAALEARLRVVRYDTRGHGQSSAPAGVYTLEDLTGDVLGLLDHLQIAKASVCGISLGGITALGLALRAPERIVRVVAANTAARIGTPPGWQDRIAQVTRDSLDGLNSLTEATLGRWFTPEFRATGDPVIAQVRAMLAATSAVGYMGCCAALRDADLVARLAEIRAPTLILAGARDPVTPVPDSDLLHERIAGSELRILPAAHLSNLEAPEPFNEVVLGFLGG